MNRPWLTFNWVRYSASQATAGKLFMGLAAAIAGATALATASLLSGTLTYPRAMTSEFEWLGNHSPQIRRLLDPALAKADPILILAASEERLADEYALAVALTVGFANELLDRMEYVSRLRTFDPASRHLTRTEPLERLRLVSLLGECDAPEAVRDAGETCSALVRPVIINAPWDGWRGLPLDDLVLEVGDDHVRWRVWPDYAPRSLFTIDLCRSFLEH